ncbi:hypothetical protein CHUAL_011929 [Chamberlinius hualienensis]
MATKLLRRELIDIGANLTDCMFQGVYNKSKKHEIDLGIVLERAKSAGVGKIIATGGNLEESKEAIKIANNYPNFIYNTVGCHPTRCSEITDGDEYINKLIELAQSSKTTTVAVGECGLDYDRLQFCDKETQKKYFERHFEITKVTGLPLFLHCRNAAEDLVDILRRNINSWENSGGVVHSFDGSHEEAVKILDLGLYIGINGCSLKTEANLDVVKKIPLDRLMIETDSPWCEIKSSHASYKFITTTFQSKKKEKWSDDCQVKGRNEPANLVQVAEAIAKLKGEDVNDLSEIIYKNSMKVFFPDLL